MILNKMILNQKGKERNGKEKKPKKQEEQHMCLFGNSMKMKIQRL